MTHGGPDFCATQYSVTPAINNGRLFFVLNLALVCLFKHSCDLISLILLGRGGEGRGGKRV